MTNLSETRAKAWKTRRAKYGQQGHAGAYTRSCTRCRRMAAMLVDLHASGVLSEGQVARATGLSRIEIRQAIDTVHQFSGDGSNG